MKPKKIKKIVKERYARIAKQDSSCCLPVESCCGSKSQVQESAPKIGYNDEELRGVPEGANLGLGCGNPVALASLKEGETVLDLGSGAGLDCFLAANKVGPRGKVIGLDMTPEMVEKAKENAKRGAYDNVEFRLGEIEKLPVADRSVDVIISNCVINLSPDKKKVFQEAFRVLKPGGRLMVSDIVLLKELPESIRNSSEAYAACIAGAIKKEDYLRAIVASGFEGVRIIEETPFPTEYLVDDPTAKSLGKKLKIPYEEIKGAAASVVSIKVAGVKPATAPK
jgi:SAM-dependent methyltransferase